MKPHIGKIGRLPVKLREQVNLRLADGETAENLLVWLNSQAEVQELLAREFGGEPVSAQNLSNWRRGGHQLWQKQQERRALVRQMAQDARELADDAGGEEVGNHWSALLTAELAQAAADLMATVADPAERVLRLQELLQTVVQVRREDYRAGKLQIERERRERERLKEADDDAWREENRPFAASIKRSLMTQLYADPDFTSQVLATQHAETLLRESGAAPIPASGSSAAGKAKSN